MKLIFLTIFITMLVLNPIFSLNAIKFDNQDSKGSITTESNPVQSIDTEGIADNSNFTLNKNAKITSGSNTKFGDILYQFCKTCYYEQVSQIKFSPNMKLLAGGTAYGKIFIWDITSGKLLYTLKNSDSAIKSLAWSKDSSILISLFKESTLNYWNVSSGRLENQINLENNINGIKLFDITNDGKMLAIVGFDKKFGLWDLNGTFLNYLLPDSKSYSVDIKFSSDDSSVALLTTSRILIWNTHTLVLSMNSSFTLDNRDFYGLTDYFGNAIDFSPDGKLLFVSLESHDKIAIYNTTSGIQLNYFIPNPNGGMINSVSHIKDKPIIGFAIKDCPACAHNSFVLYDYSKNETLLNIVDSTAVTVDISSDGSLLSILGYDETVTVYNIIQSSVISSLQAHNDYVEETKFLNKTMLISASVDNSVKIWNNNHLLKSLEDPRITSIIGLAITQNNKGDILVAFGSDFGSDLGKFFLYNMTNDTLTMIQGHANTVNYLEFSPNGSLLLSSGIDDIKIWHLSPFYLYNTIPMQMFGGYDWTKGYLFITDTTIIGSSGITGRIFKYDINGTALNEWQLAEPYNQYILSLKLSLDKSLLVMESNFGIISVLNLTSSDPPRSAYLSVFDNAIDSETFADIDITPDNRFIIGLSGLIHSFFIVDVQNLSVLVDLIFSAKGFFRFDFYPPSWYLAVGKQDYSIAVLDLSPLKDNHFDLLDFDGDGMSDVWERKYNLDNDFYLDRFDDPDQDGLVNWEEFKYPQTNPRSIDTDNDTITDTYEMKYGLDPNFNDSLLDKDGDGMNNLYEFKMNLDSSVNDSYFDYDNDGLTNLQEFFFQTDVHNPDTDFDGMPDKWEVDNRLSPINANDVFQDPDLDGIGNLDEFLGGSDPHDFFSVPIFSINNFYGTLVLIGSIIFLFSFIEYRRRLTNKFLAPDYASARKVKKSNLESWYDFNLKEKEVEKQLLKAKSLFVEGLVDQSLALYYSLVDSLNLLSKDIESSETIIRILFISHKLEKTYPIDYESLKEKFPSKSRNFLIQNHSLIFEAFENESNNNPGLALQLLNKVFSNNILPSEFSLIVFYSIIDLLIEQTQLNESNELFKDIQKKLLSLQDRAEKVKLYEFVCGAYLLTGRLYFYRYMLDEGTDYIDKVTDLATENHLYYFIQKASIEVNSFNKIKDTIKKRLLLTEETVLTLERNFEQYQKQILDYATKAKEIIDRENF